MRRLAAALALLVMFGCGSGEEGADQTVPEAPEETAAAEVNDHGTKTFTTEEFDAEIELDDFYFEPTNIKSPGGATASITLHNEGDATHTFTVPGLGVDEELEPDSAKEIKVEIGTETRYEFYCQFHKDQGMRGSFQPH